MNSFDQSEKSHTTKPNRRSNAKSQITDRTQQATLISLNDGINAHTLHSRIYVLYSFKPRGSVHLLERAPRAYSFKQRLSIATAPLKTICFIYLFFFPVFCFPKRKTNGGLAALYSKSRVDNGRNPVCHSPRSRRGSTESTTARAGETETMQNNEPGERTRIHLRASHQERAETGEQKGHDALPRT